MSTEEKVILEYLRLFPNEFVSVVQVCKRAAGRKRFTVDPEWARPHLRRLEAKAHVESNQFGHYKLTDDATKRKKGRRAACYKAITTYVWEMESTDDEKPFATLLREAIQIAYNEPNSENNQSPGDSV